MVLSSVFEGLGLLVVKVIFAVIAIILALVGLSVSLGAVEIVKGNKRVGLAIICGLLLSLVVYSVTDSIGLLVIYLFLMVGFAFYRVALWVWNRLR